MRRFLWLLVVTSVSVAGVAGCADKPSAEQCSGLLDHTIALELGPVPAGTDPDKRAAKTAKLREAAQEKFLEECEDKVTGARVACGLEARSLDELRACDDGWMSVVGVRVRRLGAQPDPS
jgi:hypothetical protein